MTIEIKSLVEIIVVVITLKLIVSRWQPPVQESIQAIICIIIGTGIGFLINSSIEGFMSGIIASGVAFYGKDLIGEFKTIKSDLSSEDINLKK